MIGMLLYFLWIGLLPVRWKAVHLQVTIPFHPENPCASLSDFSINFLLMGLG